MSYMHLIIIIGSNSYVINDNLRNGVELSNHGQKIVNDLDNALNKLPNYNGAVTRSVWINDEDLDYFLKDYRVGELVKHKSYLSTTNGEPYNPEARVQMYITSKTGKDIRKYNELEKEILFKREVSFRVKKIDTSDDYYVKIWLDEE